MNKNWVKLLCLSLLVSSGCKKDAPAGFTTFEVEDSQAFVVPAGQVLTVGPLAMSSAAPAAYAARGTDADHVQQVTPLGGSLALEGPAGQAFDALTGVKVSASATPGGQDQAGIGTAGGVAAGTTIVSLAPGSMPLDMFVRQPTYYLFVRLEPNQVLRQPTTLRVSLRYQVRARVK